MYSEYRTHRLMANPTNETTLNLSWDFVDASSGFAIDIGASSVNVICVPKDQWVEPGKRKQGTKCCVHLVSFLKKDIKQAFEYINTNAHMLKRDSGLVDIYTTGTGATPYSKIIRETLKAKGTSVNEFDCVKDTFMHLISNIPREKMLHPIYKPAFEQMEAEIQGTLAMVAQMGEMTDAFGNVNAESDWSYPQMTPVNMDKPLADESDLFPCGMMMVGSAAAFFMINADGTYSIMDGSYRTGKFFLGLGSLLTGAKTYTELMDLAAKGDSRNVNITNRSVMDEYKDLDQDKDEGGGLYSMDNDVDDQLLCTFGKADGKTIADFKKEDLARGLLESVIQDLAQTTYPIAKEQGMKHVFFTGGFVDHPLTREFLTLQWLRRDFYSRMFNPKNRGKPMIQIHLPVHAAGFGAIGAFLHNKPRSETNTKL